MMNRNFSRRLCALFLLGLLGLLGACASPKVFVDPFKAASNIVVVSQTIDAGAGRELQVVATCMSRTALTANDRAAIEADPSKADCARVDYQLFAGTTFIRDLGTAAGPIAIGAVIQGQYAKDNGNCGGSCLTPSVSTILNNNLHLPSCGGAACGTATP